MISLYSRVGIKVMTENGPQTRSNLMIKYAQKSDAGIYTCKPSGLTAASIQLHVLDVEENCSSLIGSNPHFVLIFVVSGITVSSHFQTL